MPQFFFSKAREERCCEAALGSHAAARALGSGGVLPPGQLQVPTFHTPPATCSVPGAEGRRGAPRDGGFTETSPSALCRCPQPRACALGRARRAGVPLAPVRVGREEAAAPVKAGGQPGSPGGRRQRGEAAVGSGKTPAGRRRRWRTTGRAASPSAARGRARGRGAPGAGRCGRAVGRPALPAPPSLTAPRFRPPTPGPSRAEPRAPRGWGADTPPGARAAVGRAARACEGRGAGSRRGWSWLRGGGR